MSHQIFRYPQRLILQNAAIGIRERGRIVRPGLPVLARIIIRLAFGAALQILCAERDGECAACHGSLP